jgi:5'-nucleotidase
MNSFLGSGGDNFTVFNEGKDTLDGPQDVRVLEAYIAAQSPLTPPAVDRIADLTPR